MLYTFALGHNEHEFQTETITKIICLMYTVMFAIYNFYSKKSTEQVLVYKLDKLEFCG